MTFHLSQLPAFGVSASTVPGISELSVLLGVKNSVSLVIQVSPRLGISIQGQKGYPQTPFSVQSFLLKQTKLIFYLDKSSSPAPTHK